MCIIVLALPACRDDNGALINAKVAERVGAFRAKKMEECQQSLLNKAEQIADSLLIQDAVNALNDSLARSRPGRPYQPPAIPAIDSAAVKPLFDQ